MATFMKVLVSGGTGVIGRSAITALLKAGHSVRLLSRGAADDCLEWPLGVEPWPGDVASPGSITGSAEGCDAVLHLVGIVDESPPELTFERVNVEGTRIMVNEAERAGCRRFVHVSSLGAARGTSPYHKSKLAADAIVGTFSREWVILRPGAVYGPGDEHLSILLRMVRTMPVIPSIGDGRQRFQPLWHEDLATGLAVAVGKPGLGGRILDVAGLEVTTQQGLVERLQRMTGRQVPVLPVPEFAASLGLRVMEAAGLTPPVSESQLAMLSEEIVIDPDGTNALVEELGVITTTLEEGLRRFVNEQAIQLPEDGVGALQRKTFTVRIAPSTYDAARLFNYLQHHLLDLMPALVDSDPEDNNPSRVSRGETLTLAVPIRGHIQVRVAEAAGGRITLLTLAGHPLAGAVRFLVSSIDNGVEFRIEVYDRPASVIDWMLMRPIGDQLQESTWQELALSVALVAGAERADVVQTSSDLTGDEARAVEKWVRELARTQRRDQAAAVITSQPRDL